jgi:uncharacterized membrane protein YebE (DUF533 family)
MNPGLLLDSVLRSVIGGRGKSARRATRYLTGRGGGSFLSNPATLLTAAGVAWGIYESLQGGQRTAGAAATPPEGGRTPSPQAPWSGSSHAPAHTTQTPPLPAVGGGEGEADADALRLVRLAVSAAHADGAMNEHERAAVLQQAAAAGVGELVQQEIEARRPLAEIVAGVSDPAERATLYVLAFTILRADEQVTGAERIYLAQLAALLGLDAGTVQQLENDVGERIDALGDQGQLGG